MIMGHDSSLTDHQISTRPVPILCRLLPHNIFSTPPTHPPQIKTLRVPLPHIPTIPTPPPPAPASTHTLRGCGRCHLFLNEFCVPLRFVVVSASSFSSSSWRRLCFTSLNSIVEFVFFFFFKVQLCEFFCDSLCLHLFPLFFFFFFFFVLFGL